ncbi:MAG: hypothetical protein M0Z94_06025 [Dehalococcoidales bacterium]|nr:hypothetical protein [Dehalococcoidales bacterium]
MNKGNAEVHDPADVIEIKDPEVDVAAIMQQIRQGLAARQDMYEADVFFPSFKGGDSPTATGEQLGTEFSYELEEALRSHDRAWVSLQVAPTRIPLIGGPLSHLKYMLHNLIVFYVNQLAAKQVSFNAHSVNAVRALSQMVGARASAAEVEELRREVRELREAVVRLQGHTTEQEGVADTPGRADGR